MTHARSRRLLWLVMALTMTLAYPLLPAAAAGPPDHAPQGPPEHIDETLKARLPDAALVTERAAESGRREARYLVKADRLEQVRKNWKPNAKERRIIDDHVDKMMRQGITTSADEVDIVGVEIPDVTPVYMVQDKKDALADLQALVTEGDEGFNLQMAAAYANTDEGTAQGESSGFNAGNPVGNAVRQGRGSRTLYWSPAYSSDVDHWVTTNWEKWQNTRSGQERNWVYNRYATFDAANGTSGWGGDIVDATIRTKPWEAYKSRVTGGPFDYTPRPQESCPTTATVTVSAGSYGGVEVPLVNCYSGQEIYPNGNQHSMGTAFYGRTRAQRFLDFAYEFQASSAYTEPIMADYVYMSVEYCYGFSGRCASYNPNQNLKWTDSGW